MSLKSLLNLSIVFVSLMLITSSVVAKNKKPAPQSHSAHSSYFHFVVYTEAVIGIGRINWANFSQTPFATFDTAKRGGFIFGGDLGLAFNQFIAVEVGGIFLPRVRGVPPLGTLIFDSGQLKISSWIGYLVAKVTVPLVFHVQAFVKTGLGMRQLFYDGRAVNEQRLRPEEIFQPVSAVGLQTIFQKVWVISVQMFIMPGWLTTNSFGGSAAPSDWLYTISVGRQFAV